MTRPHRVYAYTTRDVVEAFRTSQHSGLSSTEAAARLKQYGRNTITRKRQLRWVRIAVRQFSDALVWIMIVAAALAYFFGEVRDVVIISVIVLINAVIGFLQEYKAERVLTHLRKLATDVSQVIRDGNKQEVPARLLVPGDAVFVTAGDRVPADGLLVESYDLTTNTMIFTGESAPEPKKVAQLPDVETPLADITNMVFMGESVVTGEGVYIVTATGMATELGAIAHLTGTVTEETTPMQRQMRRLSRNITVVAVAIGATVMIVGQSFGMSVYDNFLFALALAVSVVPEGLPAAISVALSLGMKRLLRVNVLAKKLNAVETLGSVDVICTDKTGTITKNELTVTHIVVNDETLTVSGTGYSPDGHFYRDGTVVNPAHIPNMELLCRIGVLCNDASFVMKNGQRTVVGDPTEAALLVAGEKYNPKSDFFTLGETKVTENPFASERMRMSVVYRNAGTHAFVKGSPDVLVELCETIAIGQERVPLTPQHKARIIATYNDLSAQALRVLGFAYRQLDDVAPHAYRTEAEQHLTLVGLMGMIDPPRPDVREAIAQCKQLGIRPIMITGDYAITATAIARNVGLIGAEGTYAMMSGTELTRLSDAAIYRAMTKKDVVFARIAPDQKLRIATILKKHGHVIAMTGDGVNDAPALKRADVGVAMGVMGTDVSKEAADMILLEDNFASIVHGVTEGRTIYRNLRKFVHYVFTSNVSELLTTVIGVLLHLPNPITAVQILCIDLATDVLPSFALSVEPAEQQRTQKTSNARLSIITWAGLRRMMIIGAIMAVGAVITFYWALRRGGWQYGTPLATDGALYIGATSAVYAVLAMSQMANLLQSRSETLTPRQLGFFRNPFALIAIVLSFGILLLFLYTPLLQHYIGLQPIAWQD